VAFKVQVSLFQAGPWVRINRLQASLAHPCHTPLAVASRRHLLPLYPSHTSDPDSKGSSFLPQRSSCWSPYSSGRRGFPLFGSIHGERASWTISSPPRPRPPGLASIGLAWTLLPVNHPCWFLMGACAPSHGGPGGNLLARSQVSSSNRPSLPDFRHPPESHTGPNPSATLFQCASPSRRLLPLSGPWLTPTVGLPRIVFDTLGPSPTLQRRLPSLLRGGSDPCAGLSTPSQHRWEGPPVGHGFRSPAPWAPFMGKPLGSTTSPVAGSRRGRTHVRSAPHPNRKVRHLPSLPLFVIVTPFRDH